MTTKGFTLVEILVVIAIFTFVISLGLIMNLSFFQGDIFRTEEANLVSILEKARSRSMNNIFGSAHGVCFVSTNYRIFYGRTTCLPTSAKDEVVKANTSIASASNFSTTFPTIVWSQLAGTTTPTVVHMTDGVKSADININYEGTIIW